VIWDARLCGVIQKASEIAGMGYFEVETVHAIMDAASDYRFVV